MNRMINYSFVGEQRAAAADLMIEFVVMRQGATVRCKTTDNGTIVEASVSGDYSLPLSTQLDYERATRTQINSAVAHPFAL